MLSTTDLLWGLQGWDAAIYIVITNNQRICFFQGLLYNKLFIHLITCCGIYSAFIRAIYWCAGTAFYQSMLLSQPAVLWINDTKSLLRVKPRAGWSLLAWASGCGSICTGTAFIPPALMYLNLEAEGSLAPSLEIAENDLDLRSSSREVCLSLGTIKGPWGD